MKEERKEVLVLRKRVRFLTVHLHDDDNTVWNGLVENSGRHELSETLHNSRYLLSKNGKAFRGESKWQMNRKPYSLIYGVIKEMAVKRWEYWIPSGSDITAKSCSNNHFTRQRGMEDAAFFQN